MRGMGVSYRAREGRASHPGSLDPFTPAIHHPRSTLFGLSNSPDLAPSARWADTCFIEKRRETKLTPDEIIFPVLRSSAETGQG
jgi:hypothetical protein